jgi:hypothetical protein
MCVGFSKILLWLLCQVMQVIFIWLNMLKTKNCITGTFLGGDFKSVDA